ncbi:DUF2776 family protein, partial [Escherichia coli]|uniref:DUF2776 family protein n=1 Tax=Escherichia coli TaxID=562 RepID=UPI001F566A17
DRNRSHWSTSKTPSYTKSVSWQHHQVWLLALVWRRTCSLANRIPMIPVFTCLFCLFLASFLAEMAQTDIGYFIPSRVLVGLGAVCFTLFSIVSILEAGSAKK